MVMKSLAVVAAALPGILAQSSAPESVRPAKPSLAANQLIFADYHHLYHHNIAAGPIISSISLCKRGIVLGTFHRPILDPPAFGQPCYECVVGTPAPGDMMTVFTTSTSGATPDPTPIFDFKLCATCPLTHTTVPVPGYTPGSCVGCIDDAAVPTSVPNPTTTPSPPGGGGPGMGGPWGGPWGPPGMGGGLQTVVTCPLTNTITTISWSTILSGGEALPAWTPKIVVVGDTGAGGPPNLSGIVLPPGPGPYNSPPGGSAGGKMGSGCGSGFGCGSGAGNGNGTGPGNPKVKYLNAGSWRKEIAFLLSGVSDMEGQPASHIAASRINADHVIGIVRTPTLLR
ncbi:hypothetical protein GQ53DRAFT_764326 [Thozetella sp. PMI_491]|nr:hypothetical protein GQ53DRAFT_764326 [Thozetella sp. PMI_491]